MKDAVFAFALFYCYLCRHAILQKTYRLLQTHPHAGHARRPGAGRTAYHAVRRHGHGGTLRRRGSAAAGRSIARQRALSDNLSRGAGTRAGHHAHNRRALRTRRQTTRGASAAKQHALLHRGRHRSHRRGAAGKTSDVVAERCADAAERHARHRRRGSAGRALLRHADLEHSAADDLPVVQAVSRRHRQHLDRHVDRTGHQCPEHTAQLGVHLRTSGRRAYGCRGCRSGHAHIAHSADAVDSMDRHAQQTLRRLPPPLRAAGSPYARYFAWATPPPFR